MLITQLLPQIPLAPLEEPVNWLEQFTTGAFSVFSAIVGGLIAWWIARYQIKKAEYTSNAEKSAIKRQERENEVQRINERLFYFKWLATKIIGLSKSQGEEYVKLSTAINNNDLGTHMLPTRAMADLDRLKTINVEDVFSAVMRKHNGNDTYLLPVRKIVSHTDNISLILKEVPKMFEGMHTEVRELKVKYREIIQTINSGLLQILNEIEKKDEEYYGNDPLWKFINERLYFYNTEIPINADVDWVNENYVYPMQKQILNNFKRLDVLQSTLNLNKKALLLAGQIRFSATSMAKDLHHYGESLLETVNLLEKEVAELDKL